MRVVVDTSVWSAALRHDAESLSEGERDCVSALAELVREGRCVMLGVIRQELIQGLAGLKEFDVVAARLEDFPDQAVWSSDHVRAARMYNQCRSKGVQGTTIDMLICAVSERLKAAIFTADRDFLGYSRVLRLSLFKPTLE